jgi:beta-N-acetylhexosaminidase
VTSRLEAAPFHLDQSACDWVEETLAHLSVDEKIGQVFCLVSYGVDEKTSRYAAEVLKVGTVMCRPGPAEEIVGTVELLQRYSRVPVLMAANLEAGADGLCSTEGTRIGSPMAIAATGDVEMARRLGTACAREAAALGIHWAFAPVCDLDLNFRNPITNTRTFGADPAKVAEFASAYIRAVREGGLAPTAKHFPGDGVDERDQHLVTTVNSLSCDDWDDSYGRVYKACIEAGTLAVMVGHIALPAYTKKLRPDLADADILPASLSYELVTTLLKEKLGFNGVVATDATVMAGMMMAMHRAEAVPRAIAAGCDVFLFTRNLQEDLGYMKRGVETGLLSEERLTEAVRKVLALKAAMGLHRKQTEGRLMPDLDAAKRALGTQEHRAWAGECAERSITLVKQETGVLPLSPSKTPRVLMYAIESDTDYFGFREQRPRGSSAAEKVGERLAQEGFTVEHFVVPDKPEGEMVPYADYVDRYDLVVYVADLETKSNQTQVRIQWSPPMGADVPIFVKSIPTIFVSMANPYHLLDVPRVRTFINTYDDSEVVLDKLVEKLMGRSAFIGVSPVDAFCGKWDTRL